MAHLFSVLEILWATVTYRPSGRTALNMPLGMFTAVHGTPVQFRLVAHLFLVSGILWATVTYREGFPISLTLNRVGALR